MMIWNLNIAPLLRSERSEAAFGLLRPDGSERPAYQQLHRAGEFVANSLFYCLLSVSRRSAVCTPDTSFGETL